MIKGDTVDAEDVVSRDKFKFSLAFIDVVTGNIFQCFMVLRYEA